MNNIIPIYIYIKLKLNTIDSYFYILLLKKIVRILLGIKCKLYIFLKKNYCEAFFFFTIHLF